MPSPSHALLRRIGAEEKFIANINDLYILSNYDLAKFTPKNQKAFTASQLYGLKQTDENGVIKVVKCKIILLRDSKDAIIETLEKGKLPKCEPARFEHNLQSTEDFSLYELKKETTSVRSNSKSSSSRKPSNISISKDFIQKQTSKNVVQIDEANNSNQHVTETKPGKSEPTIGTADESSWKSVQEKSEQKQEEKMGTNKGNKRKSDNSHRENACSIPSKMIKLDGPLDSKLKQNPPGDLNGCIDGNENCDDKNSGIKTDDTTKNNVTKVTSKDESTGDSILKPDTKKKESDDFDIYSEELCSCGSTTMKDLKQAVHKIGGEVQEVKVMNKNLLEIVTDLKNQLLSAPLTSYSNQSTTVDLGGTSTIRRDWAEKVVLNSEPLKWKIEKILLKIFDKKTLYHMWFDKSCIQEEQDKLFPEDCVEKIQEFFDEANNKKNHLEILKQQAKIRDRTEGEELCARLCKQVYDSITMQNESVSRSDLKKQIGKVLYDVKTSYRKENNLPPRKAIKKEKHD